VPSEGIEERESSYGGDNMDRVYTTSSQRYDENRVISDKQADEIFQRLVSQIGKLKYTTKRNWNESETKLLNWAIHKYST
jgi:hypothetical protein